MGHRIAVVTLTSIFLLSNFAVAQGENGQPQSDNPIIIELEFVDGFTIPQGEVEFGITGRLENELMPDAVWWEVEYQQSIGPYGDLYQGIRSSGSLLPSLVEHDSNSERQAWIFEIYVYDENSEPCSCTLTVFAQEGSNPPVSATRAFFIERDTAPDDFLLTPIITLPDSIDSGWSSHSISFTGIAIASPDLSPEIGISISPSSEIRCDSDYSFVLDRYYESFSVEQNIEWMDTHNEVGLFSLNIDSNEYDDEWYDIYVFSSPHLSQPSNTFSFECFSTRVDNTAPIAIITGPPTAIEGSGKLVYDGSNTTDDIWGISGMAYIWSVKEITSSGNIPVTYSIEQTPRVISLSSEYSGIFEISLTAVDQAGNSATFTKSLEISNIAPIVRLEIGGSPVEDGDELTINRGASISVDATGTTDTPNDISSLRYIWRMDNIPMYEGIQREISWPDDNISSFHLSLEVIDDDLESNMLTIHISDGDDRLAIPSSLIVLLGSGSFLAYAINNRRKSIDIEEDIPKWV